MTKDEIEYWVNKILHSDWYYEYSDDYGVYSRGLSKINKLKEEAKQQEWTDEGIEEIKALISDFAVKVMNPEDRDQFIDINTKRLNNLVSLQKT